MKTQNVGYKQLVKRGELSAETAYNRLHAKADLDGGKIGVAVFKKSHAAKWLARRIAENSIKGNK